MLKVDLESCLQVQADIVHHINYKHDPQTFDNQMCNNTFYIILKNVSIIYHFKSKLILWWKAWKVFVLYFCKINSTLKYILWFLSVSKYFLQLSSSSS